MHAPKPITIWWPWAICGILLVATLLNYMDRQALAVTLPALKVKFNLAEGRVGMVEGCFGYAFAFGAIFFGLIADKTGPRFLYPIVLGGWSLAGIATALAGQTWLTSVLESPDDPVGTGVYHWLLICRVVLGFFEAGHWPCALLTVRAILNERDRTLGNGILQSGASIGAVIVPFYVEAAEWAGQSWEFPFWSIGIVGLLWIPAWFALVTGRDLSTPKVDSGDILESNRMDGSASQQLSDLIQRLIVLAIMIATLNVSWQFLRAWLARSPPLFEGSHARIDGRLFHRRRCRLYTLRRAGETPRFGRVAGPPIPSPWVLYILAVDRLRRTGPLRW